MSTVVILSIVILSVLVLSFTALLILNCACSKRRKPGETAEQDKTADPSRKTK